VIPAPGVSEGPPFHPADNAIPSTPAPTELSDPHDGDHDPPPDEEQPGSQEMAEEGEEMRAEDWVEMQAMVLRYVESPRERVDWAEVQFDLLMAQGQARTMDEARVISYKESMQTSPQIPPLEGLLMWRSGMHPFPPAPWRPRHASSFFRLYPALTSPSSHNSGGHNGAPGGAAHFDGVHRNAQRAPRREPGSQGGVEQARPTELPQVVWGLRNDPEDVHPHRGEEDCCKHAQ
jgi:hypothetical protein